MLVMAVAMLPQNVKAQIPAWDGTYYTWTQGSGTQADPYLIENPQHLAWLARQVNNGISTYSGVYFRLTNDLDLNSLEWTPIGNSTTNRFKGNLDGNGHFIDNIHIVDTYDYSTGTPQNFTYAGLFGVIDDASIVDVGVNTTYNTCTTGDLYICKAIRYVGGLVGYIQGGTNTITNCYNNGVISNGVEGMPGGDGTHYQRNSGGLIGYVGGGTTIITGCHNRGNVSGYGYHNYNDFCGAISGGICGYVGANLTLIDCANSGVIRNGYDAFNPEAAGFAGGLIGYVGSGTITINNSHNDGSVTWALTSGGLVGISLSSLNITNSYNIAAISGFENIGGLVGYAQNSLTVSYSCNKGTINESGSRNRYAGGLVGYNKAATNISHSFNTGNIVLYAKKYVSSSTTYYYNAYSGGIAGYCETSILAEQCYNTGVISGTADISGSDGDGCAGGIVGFVAGAANSIKECYNIGNITGTRFCGSILGYNYNNGGTSIANCYNIGSLSGGNVRTIAGYGQAPTITNCYYLETCGGSANTGSTSRTAAQMQSISFPGILNSGVQGSPVYTMDITPNINQGYPIFGDMVYAVTQQATNVGATKATLHGVYSGPANLVGFQYRTNVPNSEWNTVYVSSGSPVAYQLNGLQNNTPYIFRFMAKMNGGSYFGEEKTFTTGSCNLTASVTPSSVTICEGGEVTVTASGQSAYSNEFSYSWNTGETTSTVSVFSEGEHIVTVSDSNGCTATASVNVTVNPQPNVAISGNTFLCMDQSSMLTASGGSSYLWNTGATTPSITVSHGGIYSVTATNTYGCSKSDTVTVNSLENVSIGGDFSICQGQSTTLYVNGTGSYHWNTGDNTSSITVSQAGVYSVTVSANGCSSNASATVSVAPNPTPSILGNTTLCQGQSTTLTATGGVSYTWSNGSTQNSIPVSQGGNYSVTATSAEGCIGNTNVYVTVNPQPYVYISGNSSFCQGGNTTLVANGATSYVWSNGNGTASTTISIPGVYTVIGTDANGCSDTASKTVSVNQSYQIQQTQSICQGESYNFNGQYLTDAGTYTQSLSTVNGCDSTVILTLTVKPKPTPYISGNTTVCQNQTTTLTANGGISYLWSNSSTGNSIPVSEGGIYTVTATNAEGCSNTASVTVTVNPLPSVNISGNSSFCQGDNVTLTATGANTYAWSNSQSQATITVSNPGTYTVTGTDANGCSNTATKTVSVNPTYNTPLTHSMCEGESYNFYGQNITEAGTYTHTLQTVNGCDSVLTLTLTVKALPTPSISGNTALCEGESTTLTANGGISYNWNNDSATNSINVAESGVYTVTATNVEGCTATASATVTVNPPPIVVIGGNTSICEGGSTTLTASGADTYSWSTGENTASVNISAFGIYTVTGTSAEGCSNTSEVTVLVSQLPNITITGETDICAGESTILTANGGESYLWSNGTTEATLTVSNAGTYQVIGYNEVGCNAMASTTVNVWQPATSEFSIECPDSCYIWNDQSYCTSGDYTQTLQTVHGCDSVVTLHLTITVGLDDHNLGASMTVYPNPTNGVVNVQCTMNNVQVETMDILVYDAFGRLLRSTDGVETFHETSLQADTHGSSVQTKIDLSHFAPGVYLIKAVADGNVLAVRKVIRN